jgi:transcriptional regulator with XRE-family HTH domain
MPARLSAVRDAPRLALHIRLAIGAEFRQARLALGASQQQIGAAVHVSRNRISRVELGKATDLTVDHLVRHAAAVGLKPSVKLYPIGGGIRDIAQARYIEKFVARVRQHWRVTLDAPIPIVGDLRAVDIVLMGVCTIAVEVVTRLTDLQAMLRAAQLKQRDMGAQRLVIVVAGTRANRKILADMRAMLGPTFDLDTQRVMSRLEHGEDPGRDAIVVIG